MVRRNPRCYPSWAPLKPKITTAALLVATAAAALLYWSVQPLLGRLIIPRFGGGATSWIVCLLYFQVALLAGYLYAFLLLAKLPQQFQPWAHLAVVAGAAALLPLDAAASAWTPNNWDRPITEMFQLLSVNSAPLLVAIAATPSLATRWAASHAMERPLRVYAVSNFFSFAALVAYPIAIEPRFTLGDQTLGWTGLYAVLAAALLAVALAYSPVRSQDPATRRGPLAAWILLAGSGSALLAVVTDQITRELPVIPFLWLLPLGLYLASYVVAFARPEIGSSPLSARMIRLLVPLAVGTLAAAAWIPWPAQVAILCLTLFVVCLACHSKVVLTAEGVEQSSALYLCLAIGGAAGTAIVSILAPALFTTPWEAYLAVMAGPATIAYLGYRAGEWTLDLSPENWVRKPPPVLFALAVVLAVMVSVANRRSTIASHRGLYGTARVIEGEDEFGPYRILRHGSIMHGLQYLDPGLSQTPTSYFGQSTPLAWAIQTVRIPPERGIRVGIIGLGVGTIAAYGQPADQFKFYELNPTVVEMAQDYFSYLSDSPASVDVAVGDGRVLLEREAPQDFDLLILDAFSSEAVPTHLLTGEAGDLYLKHLAPNGLMAFHVSHRFVDLEPVVAALAEQFEMEVRRFDSVGSSSTAEEPSTWIVVGPMSVVGEHGRPVTTVTIRWTDDFSSVWPLVAR